jgi:hypothetical protein
MLLVDFEVAIQSPKNSTDQLTAGILLVTLLLYTPDDIGNDINLTFIHCEIHVHVAGACATSFSFATCLCGELLTSFMASFAISTFANEEMR